MFLISARWSASVDTHNPRWRFATRDIRPELERDSALRLSEIRPDDHGAS